MPCVILPASDQPDPRCFRSKFSSVKDCSLDYALCRAYLTALNLKFNLKSLEFWLVWGAAWLIAKSKGGWDSTGGMDQSIYICYEGKCKAHFQILGSTRDGQGAKGDEPEVEPRGKFCPGQLRRRVCPCACAALAQASGATWAATVTRWWLQHKAGSSSPKLAHATLPDAERRAWSWGGGREMEEVGGL